MDIKGHDGQSWRKRICCPDWSAVFQDLGWHYSRQLYLCRCVPCVCNGYVMGETFGILIPIVVSTFSGTNHTMMIISISACMAGGSVRRPLFTDFRYNDYGIGRGTVQPYQSRIHPAAICFGGGGCFVHYIHYCRLCAESGSAVNHWYCAYGWHAFWHKVSDEKISVCAIRRIRYSNGG